MTDLYLFRQDLRLHDNPGLAAHAGADSLLCVYVEEPPVPWCQTLGPGAQRARFRAESVCALQAELRDCGQDLLYMRGQVPQVLSILVQQFGVQRVGLADAPGTREGKLVTQLRERLPVPVVLHPGNQLFDAETIGELMPELPPHYSPFRDKLDGQQVDAPLERALLPAPPDGLVAESAPPPSVAPHPAFPARGGSGAALQRLDTWLFRERAVDTYRETRNELEGLFFSSGLSPWLANGSISVRTVAKALRDYERRHGATDSSRHLWHELLWREFFQWRALRDPVGLFRRDGRRRRLTHCTFEPRNYARWCAGETDYPLVNALMHQLVATGWMSNRGRQIAASCLVNELGIDWRYGAAFFEKHLVDFDVASNYGNWQYIAGVGADPRGGRHFNIEKQAGLYDPEGEFTARWDGYRATQPQYVTDAADWPIAEPGWSSGYPQP